MDSPVQLEISDGIATILLNRPKSFNAFGMEMVQRLAETLVNLSSDASVAGVVITGAGRAFCAGADLKWPVTFQKPYGEAFHALAAVYHQAIVEIHRMPKPVVAAINGMAAGGGFSMALACDFRVMETSAVLRQAYTSNGLSIDGGGTYSLPRLVGVARAMEIAVFDRPISSKKALEWGLATRIVEDGKSLEEALALVGEIRQGALSSFAASKRLMNESFHAPLEAQLEKEREFLARCAGHPNGREGIHAFLEKRRPEYNKSKYTEYRSSNFPALSSGTGCTNTNDKTDTCDIHAAIRHSGLD